MEIYSSLPFFSIRKKFLTILFIIPFLIGTAFCQDGDDLPKDVALPRGNTPPPQPDPQMENWNRIISGKENVGNRQIIDGIQEALGGSYGLSREENLLMTIFNDIAGYSGTINLIDPYEKSSIGNFLPDMGFGLGLNLEVRRKVFDNKLVIKDSFTVWDRLNIGINPYLSYGSQFGVSASTGFLFQIGVDNWRQVTLGESEQWAGEIIATNVKRSIEQNVDKIKIKLGKNNVTQISPDEEKDSESLMVAMGNLVDESKRKKLNAGWKKFATGQKKAIFGRIWNPITMVGRVPLRANLVNTLLGPDEVIQYTLEGGVNVMVGLSTASSLNNTGMPQFVKNLLNQGIDFTAFLTGRFKVSIKRLPTRNPGDNFVLLKFSRERDKGFKVGVGAIMPTNLHNLIKDGFSYSAGQSDSDQKGKIETAGSVYSVLGLPLTWFSDISKIQLPRSDFQMGFGHSNSRVYIFNLNTPEGRSAYNFAVFGMLSPSDKLSTNKEGEIVRNPAGPVNFVMSLDEKKQYKNWMTNFQLAFLTKYEYRRREELVDLILTDSDGVKYNRLIAELTESRKRTVLIGVDRETREHNIKVWIDEDNFNLNRPNKQFVNIDYMGLRDDLHVGISELSDYAWEIESVLNLPGLVPRAPKEESTKRILGGMKVVPKSSLGWFFMMYYGQFNGENLFHFLNTPKKDMWPIIFNAFNGERRGWKMDRDGDGNVIDKEAFAQNKARLVGQKFLWGISKFTDFIGTRVDKVNDYRRAQATYQLWKIIVCNFGTQVEKWSTCKPIETKEEKEKTKALRNLLMKFFDDPGYKQELLAIFRGSLDNAGVDRKTIPYNFVVQFPSLKYLFSYQNGDFVVKDDIRNQMAEVMLKYNKAYPPGISISDIKSYCYPSQDPPSSKDCIYNVVFFIPGGRPLPQKLQASVSYVPLLGIGSFFYQDNLNQQEILLKDLPPATYNENIPTHSGGADQGGKRISIWINGKNPKSSKLYDLFKNVKPGPRLVSRYLMTILPMDEKENQISDADKAPFYVNYSKIIDPRLKLDFETLRLVSDENSCREQSAIKIMEDLGNRHLRLCKKNDWDKSTPFSCREGTGRIPYPVRNPQADLIENEEEKIARDGWILFYCPDREYENKITPEEIKAKGICKETALKTIAALGERHFMVCDKSKGAKVGPDGFCEEGIIPYPYGGAWNFENGKDFEKLKFRSLRSRNSFIYRHCLPVE